MGRKLTSSYFTTRYIGRYTKRPVLAETRIKNYDRKTVTFEYKDKIENVFKIIVLPVEEFIKRLIVHIQDKNFRQIRYYGLYSNRTGYVDLLKSRSILKLTIGKHIEPLNWRQRKTIYNGGQDPLICPYCKIELTLVKVAYPSRDGPLKETDLI